MKLLKTIVIGACVCLAVELCGFLYLDRVFLKNESNVKIESDSHENKVEVTPEIKVLLPNEAENISMSFDGKYISYLTNEEIAIIDTDTEEKIDIPHDSTGNIPFYKWLNDRNRLVIIEKEDLSDDLDPGNNNCILKLYYYDMEGREKTLPDTSFAEPIYFEKSIEIAGLEFSTLTNLMYIKINHPGNISSLYRCNVMLQMSAFQNNGSLIGDMILLPNEDNLIYEDLSYDYIYSTGFQSQITLPNTTKPVVLGTDDQAKIYLGQSEGNKVKKIFVGFSNQYVDEWTQYDLGQGVEKKDILITADGKIFLNNSVLGKITDIVDQREYFYQGRFFKMYNNGIATTIGKNQIIKTNFDMLNLEP